MFTEKVALRSGNLNTLEQHQELAW